MVVVEVAVVGTVAVAVGCGVGVGRPPSITMALTLADRRSTRTTTLRGTTNQRLRLGCSGEGGAGNVS